MKDESLNKQVGGRHYKTLGIQPFELTLANFGYRGLQAAVYTKVNKYLSRNKGTHQDHIQDIEKAIHCLEIQLEAAREQAVTPMDETKKRTNLSNSCEGGALPVPNLDTIWYRKLVDDLQNKERGQGTGTVHWSEDCPIPSLDYGRYLREIIFQMPVKRSGCEANKVIT